MPKEVVDAPPLEGVQSQVGWGLGQPDQVGGIPAYGMEVGTKWSLSDLPSQAIQWFYDCSHAGIKGYKQRYPTVNIFVVNNSQDKSYVENIF